MKVRQGNTISQVGDKALRKPAIGFSNGSISNPFLRVPILITGGRKRAVGGFNQVCRHHV